MSDAATNTIQRNSTVLGAILFALLSLMFPFAPVIFDNIVSSIEPVSTEQITFFNAYQQNITSDAFRKSSLNWSFMHVIGFVLFLFSSIFLFLYGSDVRQKRMKQNTSIFDRVRFNILGICMSIIFVAWASVGLFFFLDLIPATNGSYLRPFDVPIFFFDQLFRGLTFDLMETFNLTIANNVQDLDPAYINGHDRDASFLFNLALFFFRLSVEFTLLYYVFVGVKPRLVNLEK